MFCNRCEAFGVICKNKPFGLKLRIGNLTLIESDYSEGRVATVQITPRIAQEIHLKTNPLLIAL